MTKRKFIFFVLVIIFWGLFSPFSLADSTINGTAKNKLAGDFEFSLSLDPEFQPRVSDQCDSKGCFLKGFIWSSALGWIALDGNFIKDTLRVRGFTSVNYARLSAANGALIGYAWSDAAGWIGLSNPGFDSLPVGRISVIEQSQTTWGVYLDFGGPPVYGTNGETLGYRLRGYAWNQKLGWIKFNKESIDDDLPDFSVYANWYPDVSPPILNATDKTWFGVNSITGALTWANFASDPESGIRLTETNFSLRTSLPACNNPSATVKAVTAANGNIDLSILGAGSIIGVPYGFCSYTLSGVITNNAGMRYYLALQLPSSVSPTTPHLNPLNFYVRAGDYFRPAPAAAFRHTDKIMADGYDAAVMNFPLQDIAGNPIITINSNRAYAGSPGRSVALSASFDNSMRFNSTSFDLSPYQPVRIKDIVPNNNLPVGAPSLFSPAPLLPGTYRMEFTSFAPTVDTYKLKLNSIEISDSLAAQPITVNFPQEFSFIPALVLENPLLSSGGIENQITIGVPAKFSYQAKSLSTQLLQDVDIDHVFNLENRDSLFLQIQKIQSQSSSEDNLGWSDPLEGETRYEFYNGVSQSGATFSGINSIFRNAFALSLQYDQGVSTSLRDDGTYLISCDFGIPKEYPRDSITGNCTHDGLIDRSDSNSSLDFIPSVPDTVTGKILAPLSPQAIDFTAEKILPVGISNVSFGIDAYVAYHFQNQPEFTIYKTPLLPGISLKDIGVEYTGIGAGNSIYQPDLQSKAIKGIEGIDTKDFTTLMRKNVASLTQNLSSCSVSSLLSGATLPLIGSCIKIDADETSVIAFYEGTSDQKLTLMGDNPSDAIKVPDGKRYTIIIKGGANLYIKNNFVYGNDSSSFGIILLTDEKDEGGNLFIDPNLTNMVGAVYAEGSLMSYVDDTTVSGYPYFYGGANPQLLNNQLLWQGSIASKNTIGGAVSLQSPAGKSCPNISQLNCAQRYDLDYLRRFTVSENKVAGNGKFSGGGSCDSQGVCTLGSLPTVISLVDTDADGIKETISLEKSTLDPFFIQKDDRRITINPPPGFSAASEQQFFQEIR
ncbi:hypothetical protein HZA43_03395 [Candidatus Peregrinibacteria bacterium]|nr:hypothetical protein [Candidatus Peregrinibacteria bacterium]